MGTYSLKTNIAAACYAQMLESLNLLMIMKHLDVMGLSLGVRRGSTIHRDNC